MPPWDRFLPYSLPDLGRRLRVAAPCVGIHGCGHAMSAMHAPADSVNVYDLEPGYAKVLQRYMELDGMKKVLMHLGKASGNLLNVPLKALESPVDLLVAGPPGPPWAGQGTRGGLKDSRAHVFLRVLDWVLYFIKCCGLMAVVLENVVGISQANDGKEPIISKFLRDLERFAP